jgi:hypothetical protein
MSVTHLPKWELTAIEISMDVEFPSDFDKSSLDCPASAEPRICVVAGFALTEQLTRIVAALARVLPARLPSRLRAATTKHRSADRSAPRAITIRPMPPLIRLQSRFNRAIEPGLVHDGSGTSLGGTRDFDEDAAQFIHDFVSSKTLPSFEPPFALTDFPETRLTATGITIYTLDRRGTPESVLKRWPYPRAASGV